MAWTPPSGDSHEVARSSFTGIGTRRRRARAAKAETGYTLDGVDSPKAWVMWVRRPPGPEFDARWHHVALVDANEVTTVCSTVIPAPVDFRSDALDADDLECADCLESVKVIPPT